MNALRRTAVESRLIAELRLIPSGTKPHMGEIRRAIAAELGSCSLAEFGFAVRSLRNQGKLHWERLELAASMLSADGVASAVKAEGGETSSPLSADGPDDEEDSGVNDIAKAGWSRPVARQAHNLKVAGSNPAPATSEENASFVPKAQLHRAGIHAAQTRAAARPLPAPEYEPEIARLVREEVEDLRGRRRSARSTATVRQPLELRKFGVADLSFPEGVASLLVESPNDLMAAIKRKHASLWRRIILLGRVRGERPAPCLYAVIEAGLESLEQTPLEVDNAA